MTIEPEGEDFYITMQYDPSFMTQVFSLLFGSNAVQPTIVDEVADMGNITIVSIDTHSSTVRLVANGQTTMSGGWYTYDSCARLATPVDRLEISGKSVDRPVIVNNASQIPTFFYQ